MQVRVRELCTPWRFCKMCIRCSPITYRYVLYVRVQLEPVNVRLAREAADREERAISKEELLASKFPTKAMCPRCFLDPNEVFDFLQQRYWPSDGTRTIDHRSSSSMEGGVSVKGTPLSTVGLCAILVPLFVLVFIFGKEFLTRAKKASSRKNR